MPASVGVVLTGILETWVSHGHRGSLQSASARMQGQPCEHRCLSCRILELCCDYDLVMALSFCTLEVNEKKGNPRKKFKSMEESEDYLESA